MRTTNQIVQRIGLETSEFGKTGRCVLLNPNQLKDIVRCQVAVSVDLIIPEKIVSRLMKVGGTNTYSLQYHYRK